MLSADLPRKINVHTTSVVVVASVDRRVVAVVVDVVNRSISLQKVFVVQRRMKTNGADQVVKKSHLKEKRAIDQPVYGLQKL